MAKPRKLDPKLQEDVDFLSTLLAKGVSGLVEFGLTDGMKLNSALKRITANGAGIELMAKTLSQFCQVNPRAMTAIELAAMMSPQLKTILEKMQLTPKEAQDVEVKP